MVMCIEFDGDHKKLQASFGMHGRMCGIQNCNFTKENANTFDAEEIY